jgi:anaerobic nitric oxide reductase flavorubredoxin
LMNRVKEGIYWVGAVDWNLRSFHSYVTHRGSSYNSYLVADDKVALIDFVKAPFAEEQIERISEVIDPKKVDYIVANHAEPDHSGSIRRVIEACPNAEVVATERCINTLQKYYGGDLKITPIEKKPTLKLGKRSLSFIPVPMAHWPDSMVSYMPEEKLLFSNDAFGQHLASSGRFDDEVDEAELMQEASTYYANILLPLWRSVSRALKALEGVPVEMIAPSHGVIWRGNPGKILKAYQGWVAGETKRKAVVVYDTMWGSTQILARAIAGGIASKGVDVKVHCLGSSHNSDVIADILDARAVIVGSPTLNNHVFPSVASFLAYMRGLKPMNKIGAAFGSFGWAGGAKKVVEAEMQAAGIQLIESDIDFVFKPSGDEAKRAYVFGVGLGEKIAA